MRWSGSSPQAEKIKSSSSAPGRASDSIQRGGCSGDRSRRRRRPRYSFEKHRLGDWDGHDFFKKSNSDDQLFIATEHGFGKRSLAKYYKVQSRGDRASKPQKSRQRPEKSSRHSSCIKKRSPTLSSSRERPGHSTPLKSVPLLGRQTQGVRLMRFKERATTPRMSRSFRD